MADAGAAGGGAAPVPGAPNPSIKFKVVYCSSVDDQSDPEQLSQNVPNGTGWCSQRFPEYPQVLVLALEKTSDIRKIQLLSHQNKIAKAIEVYVGVHADPSKPSADQSHASFTRLGYLSLDNTERSNFKARELKTVFVHTRGSFLKFVIKQNHVSPLNLFNQVSIIAIRIVGGTGGGPGGAPGAAGIAAGIMPAGMVSAAVAVAGSGAGAGDDLVGAELLVDAVTAKQLRELGARKEMAIRREDYESAKRIKHEISQLKKLGVQLAELERRKATAVQAEDFDTAAGIKKQMETLRAQHAYAFGSGGGGGGHPPPSHKAHQKSGEEEYDDRPARGGGGGGYGEPDPHQQPPAHARKPSSKAAAPGGAEPPAMKKANSKPKAAAQPPPPPPQVPGAAGAGDEDPPDHDGAAAAEGGADGQLAIETDGAAGAAGGGHHEQPMSGSADDRPLHPAGGGGASAYGAAEDGSAPPPGGKAGGKKKVLPPDERPLPRRNNPSGDAGASGAPGGYADERPLGGGAPRDLSKVDDPFGGRNKGGKRAAGGVPVSGAPEDEVPASGAPDGGDDDGGGGDYSAEVSADGTGLPPPETMNAATRKTAEPLINVLGEHMAGCLFSKTWSLRAFVVKRLSVGLHDGGASLWGVNGVPSAMPDKNTLIGTVVSVLKRTLNDRNETVFLSAITLLHHLVLKQVAPGGAKAGDGAAGLEPVVAPLLDKLASNMARSRVAAHQAILFLALNKCVGSRFVTAHLIAPLPKKDAAKPLPLLGRGAVLLELIPVMPGGFDDAKGSMSGAALMKMIVPALTHRDPKVRALMFELAAVANAVMGAKRMQPLLKDVKPPLSEQLATRFGQPAPNHKPNTLPPLNPNDPTAPPPAVAGAGAAEYKAPPPPPQVPAAAAPAAAPAKPAAKPEKKAVPAAAAAAPAAAAKGNAKAGGAAALKGAAKSPTGKGAAGVGGDDKKKAAAKTKSPAEAKQKPASSAAAAAQAAAAAAADDNAAAEPSQVSAAGAAPVSVSAAVGGRTCQFCDASDPQWTDEKLDLHYWQDCPMLTSCKHCEQVIEITTLAEHLLKECESANVQECPRCGEPVPNQGFDEHVKRNACSPKIPPAKGNRCPLCHRDIAAGDDGWRLHLLDQGCPNNPRTSLVHDEPQLAPAAAAGANLK